MPAGHSIARALLIGAALALCACSKNDLRAVNAMADANTVSISLTDKTASIDDLAFGASGGATGIPVGNHRAQLVAVSDLGSMNFVADPVTVARDHVTTVYAIGRVDAGSGRALVIETQNSDVPSSQTEVQLINAAAGQAGALDVYVTAPGALLSTQTPLASLVYSVFTEPLRIAAGTYEIRVTPSGDPSTVIYDSGSVGVALDAGSRRQITLLDHLGTGVASPLTLLFLPQGGSASTLDNGAS